jgi:hypothetical protein
MATNRGAGLGFLLLFGLAAWLASPGEKQRPSPTPPAARTAYLPTPPSASSSPPPAVYSPPTQPPPFASPAPEVGIVSTTARVNMRTNPASDAPILARLERGTKVRALSIDGDWQRVAYGPGEGWIHRSYLTAAPSEPNARVEEPPKQKPNLPPSPAPQIARVTPRARSFEPARAPFVGTCDCPYDLMRNGRACGGRSAYNRPGGRSPVCYQ